LTAQIEKISGSALDYIAAYVEKIFQIYPLFYVVRKIFSKKRNDLEALLTMVMFHSTSKVYKVGRAHLG